MGCLYVPVTGVWSSVNSDMLLDDGGGIFVVAVVVVVVGRLVDD